MKYELAVFFLLLSGCGVAPTKNGVGEKQVVTVGSNQAVIYWPSQRSTVTKWVWYAPVILPDVPAPAQLSWYIEQMNSAGVAVVGVDVGESYGSLAGRAVFSSFYAMMPSLGLASHGCMLLQSRGGLMGYTWILDNPGIITAVAGIYPLTDLNDYLGPNTFAPAWGVSAAYMNANMATLNPLNRAAEITIPIFHLHGDADTVVHLAPDQQFVATAPNASLTVIPGQGHEGYSVEFFHSEVIVQFLKGYL